MSFLPSTVHYCADLLRSVKRGGAAQDGKRRQLLRMGITPYTEENALGEGVEVGEKEKVKEKICIKCQMGLTPDF